MRYFLDTEFIEYPCTIDLISIGIVSDDHREYYAISTEFDDTKASDWVMKNVLYHLPDLFPRNKADKEASLLWKSRSRIASDILSFCSVELYGKPEFWGYYADYDWVCIAWLFGAMVDLPKGWPMYCRDLKQWADAVGNPALPAVKGDEHNALVDARRHKAIYGFLAERFGPWGQ